MGTPPFLSIQDISKAALRISRHIDETPLLESPLLNDLLGLRLLVKAEVLQITGSFKLRGAFNQLLSLGLADKAKGVVAFSSGNHAQAVAYAAQYLHVPATIVMPEDAPAIKLQNTKAYGATVVTYDRHTEDREALGERIARESGFTLIHPFDDLRTIAGQGTVGLEIYQHTHECGIHPKAIFVPCSGGGLSAGIAVTRDLYDQKPDIYVIEPQGNGDAALSLEAGVLTPLQEKPTSLLCDALLAPSLGKQPFGLLQKHKARGLTVSDDAVFGAMHVAMEYFKLTLEPSGAVALAQTILSAGKFQGEVMVAVASGGNVDPESYGKMLQLGRSFAPQLLKFGLG